MEHDTHMSGKRAGKATMEIATVVKTMADTGNRTTILLYPTRGQHLPLKQNFSFKDHHQTKKENAPAQLHEI
jgi:hypothetical protein